MKLKELKKLSKSVQKATVFAEQIKNQVHSDLSTLATLDTTIEENLAFLNSLNTQVAEAQKTLTKLSDLLE